MKRQKGKKWKYPAVADALAVAAGCFCANKNVTSCSQNKQLYKIEKSCIIYVVAAVALQAQVLCV